MIRPFGCLLGVVLLLTITVVSVQGWTTSTVSFAALSTSTTTVTRKARRIQQRQHPWISRFKLDAKRNKRAQARQDEADLNRWYESVDENASPDDVFWEEMERQRLLAKVGESSSSSSSDMNMISSSSSSLLSSSGSNPNMNSIRGMSSSSGSTTTTQPSQQSLAKTNSLLQMAAMNGQAPKSAEATLSEYAAYMCSDNWLDEELVWMMRDDAMYNFNDDDGDENQKSLDEQLDEWEALEDSDDKLAEDDQEQYLANAWMISDEPWDHWAQQTAAAVASKNRKKNKKETRDDDSDGDEDDDGDEPPDSASGWKYRFSPCADAFLFRPEDVTEEEMQRFEQETLERLSKITLHSPRLERARKSRNAKAYFQRDPDRLEGYDRMWVSAIDNVCFKNLVGLFGNYGVQFADNFGDWQDGSMHDSLVDIEDIALYKARKVYNVTGLPCIASRTSFEIEPVPTSLKTGATAVGRSAMANANPRVTSGYKFNDVGMHVDYICEALRPLSEPSRVTRFTSCLCFYDGEVEFFDYGICDVDLYFSNSLRTFIPMSQAINEILEKLTMTFDLEYQQWLKSRVNEAESGGSLGVASVKLRDRVLKEGRVLPNDIIDVSAFMDSKVDVNLMDECAKELASRFFDVKPSKILTVATTGLVIALPVAKYLQVPVVYARKERNVVMANTYKAGYSSKTVGLNRELLVSRSHLDEDDRVLIVDDFLSSGSSQEALLRIISEAGAKAVGVGVLLEKVYDSGRQSLSGFDVPIHSLCRIFSVKDGVIQLEEEEGFDRARLSQQLNKNNQQT